MVSVPGPTRASCVRVRRSAPDKPGGGSSGPEHLVSRRSNTRHGAPVGACGISQVSWRSIPCLCPAPRPRPSRQDLASAILSVLPPVNPNRRPQRAHNLEANTGLQHPLSTLHERRYRHPCKTRFRLAGCASTGRASNPLDHFERFQATSILLSRTSPVASRVDGDVAAPIPHRPGRADFPHPVLHERGSLTAAYPWRILTEGSGWRARSALKRAHGTTP